MAIFAATDFRIEINGVNHSAALSSVEAPINVEALDSTAFGSGWKSTIGGLKGVQVTLNFNQDFAATTVDDRIWALLGTVVPIKLRPTSGAISATNPEYQFNVLVSEWRSIGGKVGELAQVSVTWPGSGTVTRATA